MKNSSTAQDLIRLSFVDELYKQLRNQTKTALADHNRIISKATMYLEDGLSDSECSELLVIEGLKREAAASYVQLAKSNSDHLNGQFEYSFQFEDAYGKVWSSYDIGKTVYASSDRDAWEMAEGVISEDSSIEPEKIISVDRIS